MSGWSRNILTPASHMNTRSRFHRFLGSATLCRRSPHAPGARFHAATPAPATSSNPGGHSAPINSTHDTNSPSHALRVNVAASAAKPSSATSAAP